MFNIMKMVATIIIFGIAITVQAETCRPSVSYNGSPANFDSVTIDPTETTCYYRSMHKFEPIALPMTGRFVPVSGPWEGGSRLQSCAGTNDVCVFERKL